MKTGKMSLFRLFIAGVVLVLTLTGSALAGRIVLVASYHQGNEWSDQCIAGLKELIGPVHELDIIYMDTKRRPESAHAGITASVLQTLAAAAPDLIMTADDNALKYLAPAFEKIKTPVVFYGINGNPRDYFGARSLPRHVTGVLERRMLMALGRMIHKIVPVTHRRYLILFDDSWSTKALIRNTLHGEKTIRFQGLTMEWKSLGYLDEWQRTIRNAHQTCDALILETWYTIKDRNTGDVIPESEILALTARESPVPLFGTKRQAVGPGKLVGAKALSGVEHGRDAAKMALAILDDGTHPSALPVRATLPTTLYFNLENLKRYRLTLPPDMEKAAVFQ